MPVGDYYTQIILAVIWWHARGWLLHPDNTSVGHYTGKSTRPKALLVVLLMVCISIINSFQDWCICVNCPDARFKYQIENTRVIDLGNQQHYHINYASKTEVALMIIFILISFSFNLELVDLALKYSKGDKYMERRLCHIGHLVC